MDCAQRDQCLRLLVQCGILGEVDVSLLQFSFGKPQIHSLRTSHIFTTCVSKTYSRSVISSRGQ
jgi:hypothetical protein